MFFWGYSYINPIKTLLNPTELDAWLIAAKILGAAIGLHVIIISAFIALKKDLNLWYGLLSLGIYGTITYLFILAHQSLIPSDVPRWMFDWDVFFAGITILMPTLLHSLLVLVIALTPDVRSHKKWQNAMGLVGIPLLWYIGLVIILPMFNSYSSAFFNNLLPVLFACSSAIFLFFLVQLLYIWLYSPKSKAWETLDWIWMIPICLGLPLLGLSLNQNHDFFGRDTGFFGDFSNPWFLWITLANGIFLCLPQLENIAYRAMVFMARMLSLPFTLYFFIVFLPFVPLGLIGAFFAIGFLLLSPLLLFLVHLKILREDFIFIYPHFNKIALYGVGGIAFLALPLGITLSFLKDKNTLTQALAYVYYPNENQEMTIDKIRLQKTITHITHYKKRNSQNAGTPFLSSYYNGLVMDRMSISNQKLDKLSTVFLGKTLEESTQNAAFFQERFPNTRQVNQEVEISETKVETQYNLQVKAYESWVHFTLSNRENNNAAEFTSTFELPEGVFISDYYLYVNNRKDHGMLAEEKTATWIYNQIRNEAVAKDPGIVKYLNDHTIAFNVFPFTAKQHRKTGIKFLHQAPFSLKIKEKDITIGKDLQTTPKVAIENVTWISAATKAKLPKVKRQPYYHFIADISNKKEAYLSLYKNQIYFQLKQNLLPQTQHKISFVNATVKTVDFDPNDDWEKMFEKQICTDGFFLERAFQLALHKQYQHPEKRYPIFVILSPGNLNLAVMEGDFSNLAHTFPEQPYFYHQYMDAKLYRHSFVKIPKILSAKIPDTTFNHEVYAYPNAQNPIAYLPIQAGAAVVVSPKFKPCTLPACTQKGHFSSALNLWGKWKSGLVSPNPKNDYELVKQSFSAQILSPKTAYLVLENEAQKALLKQKQETVLKGNPALDVADQDLQAMSEPNLWVLLLLLLVALGGLKLRRVMNE